MFGPHVIAARGVDELCCDTNPITKLPCTALKHITYTQLSGHLLYINRSALIDEDSVACDNEEPANFGQSRDDVLCNAIRKELLVGVGRHVDEGHDRDRRFMRHGNR